MQVLVDVMPPPCFAGGYVLDGVVPPTSFAPMYVLVGVVPYPCVARSTFAGSCGAIPLCCLLWMCWWV